MRSIEWHYFQWPWVTPNNPFFYILQRLSYFCDGWN